MVRLEASMEENTHVDVKGQTKTQQLYFISAKSFPNDANQILHTGPFTAGTNNVSVVLML